jgi:hypothetical protein
MGFVAAIIARATTKKGLAVAIMTLAAARTVLATARTVCVTAMAALAATKMSFAAASVTLATRFFALAMASTALAAARKKPSREVSRPREQRMPGLAAPGTPAQPKPTALCTGPNGAKGCSYG